MPRNPIVQALPPSGVPLVNSDGTVNLAWYRYFQNSFQREGGGQDQIWQQQFTSGFFQSQIQDLANRLDDNAALAEQIRALVQSLTQQLTDLNEMVQLNDVRAQLDNVSQLAQNANSISDILNQISTLSGSITAQARAAVSGTGAIAYNGSTGVFSLPTQTGWAADTGTDNRGANATYVNPTAGAVYSQTQMQGVMNALQAVTQAVKSLKTDLTTTNIIGP